MPSSITDFKKGDLVYCSQNSMYGTITIITKGPLGFIEILVSQTGHRNLDSDLYLEVDFKNLTHTTREEFETAEVVDA